MSKASNLETIKKLVKHPLFSHTAVMVIGSNLANFFAAAYTIVVARVLPNPAMYSDVASIISLFALFTAIFNFLGIIIIKFVSSAKTESEKEEIFSWFTKKILIFGLVLLAILTFATPLISDFLHIDYKVAILVGPLIFFTLLSFSLKSFLQGLLSFGKFVTINNLEFLSRLIFSVIFIFLGLSVFGAVFGILSSLILSSIILWRLLYKFNKNVKSKLKIGPKVVSYALPAFLFSLTTTLFLSTDIILSKHFLSATDAGYYAALSTVGKIVLYALGPIGAVMFPLVSKKHASGEDYKHIFVLSLSFTTIVSVVAIVFYVLVPQLPMMIIYGARYLSHTQDLVWFGIYATIFSLCSLIGSFYLSIGKLKIILVMFIFSIFQILGIISYHDSILSIIHISTLTASFLLVVLLIYMGYDSFYRRSRV